MLSLLEERNRRVRSGLYRDSISLAMSVFTLPFAEQYLGQGEPGSLWENRLGINDALWDLIHEVLKPAALTRRAVSASIRTMVLQERLKNLNLKRLTSHPGYPHARELAILQNNVLWHMETLEDSLPPPAPGTEKKKRHHRGNRARKKNISVPGNENPTDQNQ